MTCRWVGWPDQSWEFAITALMRCWVVGPKATADYELIQMLWDRIIVGADKAQATAEPPGKVSVFGATTSLAVALMLRTSASSSIPCFAIAEWQAGRL